MHSLNKAISIDVNMNLKLIHMTNLWTDRPQDKFVKQTKQNNSPSKDERELQLKHFTIGNYTGHCNSSHLTHHRSIHTTLPVYYIRM